MLLQVQGGPAKVRPTYIFCTCKLHTKGSGVMQILRKFYHNEHLTREMAPLRSKTTDAYSYRQLLKLLQIVHLLRTGK